MNKYDQRHNIGGCGYNDHNLPMKNIGLSSTQCEVCSTLKEIVHRVLVDALSQSAGIQAPSITKPGHHDRKLGCHEI